MDNNMKNSKMKTFGMLDIFVRYEAMNFSIYSARNKFPSFPMGLCISFIHPDLNYLTIANIKQCLVFN